ncbi:MAG: hypothetical protein GIW97_09360 [Candidatus Eremiobacteraeota bacterium]|nr:hypothetical protein [Candidatus Eremiobacteraeota bacterium]
MIQTQTATRDGRHDFDFLIGTWKSHYKVLKSEARLCGRPITANDWHEFDGRNVIRPFWDGRGNTDEGILKRSTGRETLTLRLYNAETHEWTLYWATADLGLGVPPQVGHFNEHGVGEFFANDTWNDQPIVVRYHWTHQGSTWHFEQAFSPDNGKTWETNWISDSVEKLG